MIGLARPWLRLLAREGYRVADVLDRLNQLLLDDATEAADAAARALVGGGRGRGPGPTSEGPQTRFLSLLYGELVPFERRRALHPRLRRAPAAAGLGRGRRRSGTAAEPQTLLGVVEDATYTSETFDLCPGDTLLCVTDGVTERRSGPRQFDDDDGLADALAGCAGLERRADRGTHPAARARVRRRAAGGRPGAAGAAGGVTARSRRAGDAGVEAGDRPQVSGWRGACRRCGTMEGMPSALPDGEPVPDDGALPAHALAGAADRPLGFYLHVPYCATRCGYCDFNTYTATELRGTGGVLASRDNYADTLIDEVRLARKVLGDDPRPVRTVFVGGGTPTLLAADDLVRMLGAIRDEFGLAEDAEVTTEANPESVDPRIWPTLREGGFNRISFGMQSARQHVLKVLDRTHTPGRPEACVAEARAVGFEHVNLDLIYGTPG